MQAVVGIGGEGRMYVDRRHKIKQKVDGTVRTGWTSRDERKPLWPPWGTIGSRSKTRPDRHSTHIAGWVKGAESATAEVFHKLTRTLSLRAQGIVQPSTPCPLLRGTLEVQWETVMRSNPAEIASTRKQK